MASDIQRCVDAIGELLSLPVSLTDVDLNSLRFSPHTEDLIDEVRRDSLLMRHTAPWVREWFAEYGVGRTTKPVRVEPHPDRDTMSRLVVPVQHRGVQLGLLCVLDPDRRCNSPELASMADLLSELAALMYDAEADRLQTSHLVHDLIVGSASAQARALKDLHELTGVTGDDEYVAATISGVQGPPKPVAAREGGPHEEPRVARTRPGAARTATAQPELLQSATATDHHVFLLPAPVESAATGDLGRIIDVARGCCGTPVVGIGQNYPLAQAAQSYRQAQAAMSAAARLDQLPAQVAYADLGAHRTLAASTDPDLDSAIDPLTRVLIDAGDDELLATLTAYLESGCDAAATAAHIHVHRDTLYYRLRKAETLTGLDLTRGPDRLTLHLGLLSHQWLTSPRRPSHDTPVRLLVL